MKMLVAVPLAGTFAKQEEVKVEKMIFVNEFLLALHRPTKGSRDEYSLWSVSDMASGIRVAQSISSNLAIKMAIKRTNLHRKYFLETRKKVMQTTVFVD